ncbi:hypothetical protein ACFU7Y_02535 [Kitasatospora sp. NPDC057542]|uniref:hypothetical protein n=1 Tax=Streptomycetaceae TaxID=2062 RepID=UPI001CCC05C4|nr:hypothetical protein [Streptomyces sp. LS1784]
MNRSLSGFHNGGRAHGRGLGRSGGRPGRDLDGGGNETGALRLAQPRTIRFGRTSTSDGTGRGFPAVAVIIKVWKL